MIITVTLNPAYDKTVEVDTIEIGGLNRISRGVVDIGGKGINVSKTLIALGGISLATGFMSRANGQLFVNELDRLHIDYKFVEVQQAIRTNLKIFDGNRVITELNEDGPVIGDNELQNLLDQMDQLLQQQDILVLGGSVPDSVDKHIYYDLLKLAKAKGCKTILDADGELFTIAVKAIPNVIKPNRFELQQYANIENATIDDLVRIARQFISEGIEIVAVSLGKEGAIFINKDDNYFAPGLILENKSTVGAGDAMVAALTYSLSKGDDLREMAMLAVATASATCLTSGTQTADPEMIVKLKEQVILEKL